MTQASGNESDSRRWTYNQRTGQLRDPDGVVHEHRGYSGWHEGGYRNNPEMEGERFRGPIPRGLYTIGRDVGTRGPLTLVLEPEGHNALNRTELRIHGDSRRNPGTASEGCIILNRNQRDAIHNSPNRILDVVDEQEWEQQ